jgi:E3 ubiquitin-protein ligase DOA10
MKSMNPFSTSTKKKSSPQYSNFIEAFKDIGKSTVKSFAKDFVGGTAKNAVDTLTKGQASNEQPEEKFNFEEYLNAQEQQIRNQERARFEAIKREENVIFSREKQQIKVQIETLQTQIKGMAKDQAGLMSEIDKTAFQAVVNPGVYHQNFFDRLIHLIKIARKKIADSRSWMSLHNHRGSQKNGYWQNVKSKGTSFLLSGERTVATQTG